MKTCHFTQLRTLYYLVVLSITFMFKMGFAQDFNVVPSGISAYNINGQNNPALTLMRGVTYVFSVNAIGHPFWVKTNQSTGTGNAYTNGVTGNGVQNSTLTFAVPTNAPNKLFYNCEVHAAMTGTLNITNAPGPLPVNIVYISVADLITLKSTGTNGNGWSVIPEYNCDLSGTNWTVVSPVTNSFANGTNTTTFDRLDPLCGSTNVFIRVRNQQN